MINVASKDGAVSSTDLLLQSVEDTNSIFVCKDIRTKTKLHKMIKRGYLKKQPNEILTHSELIILNSEGYVSRNFYIEDATSLLEKIISSKGDSLRGISTKYARKNGRASKMSERILKEAFI